METREFGTRLRELRKQVGLSQRELADKIGISFTYLSKIESGVMPPPSEKIMLKLAEALNADKDELMTLAGKIPSDIVQILKNREALQLLRSDRTQKKIGVANKKEGSNIMKNLVSYKRLSKVAIAVVLVFAVAASLWFVSPLPAKALKIDITNPQGTALQSGTLGRTYEFRVKVSIEDTEHLPIQSIDLRIYNVANSSTYYDRYTDLSLGGTDYVSYSTTGAGASALIKATAEATWGYFEHAGYAFWQGRGYYFPTEGTDVWGYGYSGATGTTSITYDIKWTPPSSWPRGDYRIEAEITTAQHTFTQLSSQFTLSVRRYGVAPAAPPAAVEPGVTPVSDVVTSEGVFTEPVTAESEDGKVELAIDEDTIGLTEEGEPLSEITAIEMAEPPAPPVDANVVGLTYDLGPDGATFDPPITVSFTYDPAEIPEGVNEEDLVIAMWDEDAGEWVELEDCTVDPVTHTITAPVSHFTAFTILAAVAPPIEYAEYEAALAALAEAEAAMAQAEADVAAAQAQVTSAQSDIDTTEAKIASLQADVAAAQAEVTSAQSDLTAAQERLAAAQERVDELEAVAGPAWWVWLIVGLAAVVVIGVVIWLVLRRRTAAA